MRLRLKEFRVRSGLTIEQAAERLGLSTGQVSKIESGKSDTSLKRLQAFAALYKCSAADLIKDSAIYEAIRDVLVIGAVQAGNWRETIEWPPDEQYVVQVKEDPRFPGAKLTGLEVRGPSMNNVYPEGTVLICVSVVEQKIEPQNEQNVIVQRKDKHGLLEATVKELEIRPDGRKWLWPRSENPDHQQPLEWMPDHVHDDDGVLISGLVIQAIKPE